MLSTHTRLSKHSLDATPQPPNLLDVTDEPVTTTMRVLRVNVSIVGKVAPLVRLLCVRSTKCIRKHNIDTTMARAILDYHLARKRCMSRSRASVSAAL